MTIHKTIIARLHIVTTSLLLLLVIPSYAAPTWHNIGPGGGGWVPAIVVSPVNSKVIYAGCDVGGFYRSTDAGATWKIYNTGLRDYYVETIVPHPKDPNVIYIGTQGGIHKSTNGGKSWKWLRNGFPAPEMYSFSAPIGALAIDPLSPSVLYAGIGRPRWNDGGKGAIYRTEDSGAHWKLVNPGGGGMDPSAIISSLIVHTRNSKRIYAVTDHGLYRSNDSGSTWEPLSRGLPITRARRIALCASRPEIMYASFDSLPGVQPRQGGVFRSTDGGNNWKPCNNGLGTRVGQTNEPIEMTSNIDHLVVDPKNPNVVYAGDTSWVSDGVYRSINGGNSWKKTTDSSSPKMKYGWITMWGPSVMALAMDPRKPSNLYFTTSGHTFRTTDSGEHWQAIYTKSVTKPASAPQTPRGWWKTNGLEVTCLNQVIVHPRDPKRLYVCYFDIGLLQSFDGGQSFTHTVEGMAYRNNTFTVAFDPDDPNIVYAATGEWTVNRGDLCRSDDGGFTWKVVGKPETGLPDGQIRNIIVDAGNTTKRIYVTVEGSGIYYSADNGNTWQSCSNGLPNKGIRNLIQHPKNPSTFFVLITGTEKAGGGVYRSVDQGESWLKISKDFLWSNATSLTLCKSDPNRMYLSSRDEGIADIFYPGGVFASNDGGITWQQVLKDRFIQALAVDPNNADIIYAGGTDHPYHDEAIGSGVTYSKDGGKTWQTLNTPELTCRNISCLTINPHIPGTIYAGTHGNGVFVYKE
jgi:photosystem II stability/assembly factor-like uncharacterized protein